MFGKVMDSVTSSWATTPKFQSPCAGNMFGKMQRVHTRTHTLDTTHSFQSPCAGNMFGKDFEIIRFLGEPAIVVEDLQVSIPVCGEHVW